MNEDGHSEDDIRLLTQWIDGEADEAEAAALLKKTPAFKKSKKEAAALGALLRLNAAPNEGPALELEPAFPDLFNRQILRRIAEEKQHSLGYRVREFFSWFVSSEWALPAAASASLVALMIAGAQVGNDAPGSYSGIAGVASSGDAKARGPVDYSEVVHTYAPHEEHSAVAEFVPEAASTVITLEGLKAIDGNVSVAGFFPSRSEYDAMVASTTLYSADDKPFAVLTTSLAGVPRIQRVSLD